jgi:phage regulator Rha-like protein
VTSSAPSTKCFLIPDVEGKRRRSFNVTRDGLMLLVMGWAGKREIAMKIRIVETFEALRAGRQTPEIKIQTHPRHVRQCNPSTRRAATRGRSAALRADELNASNEE